MTWIKLDDAFPNHPKMVRAGPAAGWLWVCATCYCGRYLTDGFIPKEAVTTLTTLRQPGRLAATLVEVGAWHDRGDSYEVHDYLKYNPSRTQVEADREAARERAAKRARGSPEVRAKRERSSDAPSRSRPEVPAEPSGGKPRDRIFEAVCEACGWALEELTKTARGRANEGAKQFRDMGVTADEILVRAERYRAKYPDAAVTPQALAGNWAALANPVTQVNPGKPDEPRSRFCGACGEITHSPGASPMRHVCRKVNR